MIKDTRSISLSIVAVISLFVAGSASAHARVGQGIASPSAAGVTTGPGPPPHAARGRTYAQNRQTP